jgi:hypothetical protein
VGRRRFDHLHLELSLAVGERLPRYALWLAVHDAGLDPERLSRDDALDFLQDGAPGFLARRALRVPRGRTGRRLRRNVARFDPALPTPEERFASLAS